MTNLARLWRDQGKTGEARDLLLSVYGWSNEGFDKGPAGQTVLSLLMANNGLSGHVAGTSALPPIADLRVSMSAFAPISSASPQELTFLLASLKFRC